MQIMKAREHKFSGGVCLRCGTGKLSPAACRWHFSVTQEIVTHESAEDGEAESRDTLDFCPLRDAVKTVRDTRTCHVGGVESIECDSSLAVRPRSVTVNNSMEFLTGAQESRTLHIPEQITASSARRIARLIGAKL